MGDGRGGGGWGRSESGVFFFFQAEDGIRDIGVTGVQTCALPILRHFRASYRYENTLVDQSKPTYYPNYFMIDISAYGQSTTGSSSHSLKLISKA